ncbi:MAG: NapC/NirT family cytochrome c [SAR324 cluster bacterium]|nr:NapC/NirT family cytochrome c [SAR324 cluster bacterium]
MKNMEIRRIGIGILLFIGILMSLGGISIQLENHNSFCASCHTEPETTYYQRTLTAKPIDLATRHGEKALCIDCHSGEGILGRMSSLTLGAKDLAKFISRTHIQPAQLSSPLGRGHCLKCHATIANKVGFEDHFHGISALQEKDDHNSTCVACHKSHSLAGNPKISFLDTRSVKQTCEVCHDDVPEIRLQLELKSWGL